MANQANQQDLNHRVRDKKAKSPKLETLKISTQEAAIAELGKSTDKLGQPARKADALFNAAIEKLASNPSNRTPEGALDLAKLSDKDLQSLSRSASTALDTFDQLWKDKSLRSEITAKIKDVQLAHNAKKSHTDAEVAQASQAIDQPIAMYKTLESEVGQKTGHIAATKASVDQEIARRQGGQAMQQITPTTSQQEPAKQATATEAAIATLENSTNNLASRANESDKLLSATVEKLASKKSNLTPDGNLDLARLSDKDLAALNKSAATAHDNLANIWKDNSLRSEIASQIKDVQTAYNAQKTHTPEETKRADAAINRPIAMYKTLESEVEKKQGVVASTKIAVEQELARRHSTRTRQSTPESPVASSQTSPATQPQQALPKQAAPAVNTDKQKPLGGAPEPTYRPGWNRGSGQPTLQLPPTRPADKTPATQAPAQPTPPDDPWSGSGFNDK